MPMVPIKNPDISEEEKTYLTSAVAAAGATLNVVDYEGFSDNDYLVVGPYGKEQTEIVKVDDASIDTSISLDATDKCTYAHPAYTQVTKIPWDQVEVYSATSETGTYSLLTTMALEVDDEYTYYNDTAGSSTTWYKVRFKNTQTTTYSDYSDVVQATGYKTNSRGRMKSLVKSLFGDKYEKWVTDTDLDNFFYHIENEILNFRKRWTFEQASSTYDLQIGTTKYALDTVASDIKETEKKYVAQVYIENNDPLIYLDRQQMNEKKESAKWTTIASAVSIGAITITVDDASVLDSADTLLCGGEDDIAYTSKDDTTNILSGVTGVTSAKSVGDEVWADEEGGEPEYYTIWGGKIEFDVPPDEAYTLHLDYTKDASLMDSDADVSVIPFTQLIMNGVLALCYQAKGDTKMYNEKWSQFLDELKERSYAEREGQKKSLTPSDREMYQKGVDYVDFEDSKLKYRITDST